MTAISALLDAFSRLGAESVTITSNAVYAFVSDDAIRTLAAEVGATPQLVERSTGATAWLSLDYRGHGMQVYLRGTVREVDRQIGVGP